MLICRVVDGALITE